MLLGLLDRKGLIKKECPQSTFNLGFKSNDSVTIVDIAWYRVPGSK